MILLFIWYTVSVWNKIHFYFYEYLIDDLDIPFYLYTVYYTFGKTDASIPSEIVNSVSILNKGHTSHIKTRICAFLFYDFLTHLKIQTSRHTWSILNVLAKNGSIMKIEIVILKNNACIFSFSFWGHQLHKFNASRQPNTH